MIDQERICEYAAAFIEKHRPITCFEPGEWPAEVKCRCGFTLKANSRNELTAFWVQHTVGALMVDQDAALQTARKKLWLSHGHMGLYGDDGEMQCQGFDFKRAPFEECVAHSVKAMQDRQRGGILESDEDEAIPPIKIPPGAKCQEASPRSRETYIACGAPAVALIWHEKDRRAYWMCFGCADHNVRHRGGKLVAGKIG